MMLFRLLGSARGLMAVLVALALLAVVPTSAFARDTFDATGTVYSKNEDKETIVLITDDLGVKNQPITVDMSDMSGQFRAIKVGQAVTITEGPRAANPALFPNTVINSPASQVSIWNNIQGFNTTIATGFTSSIDAMSYAYDFLRLERVKLVFAGSVEEMCFQTFYGFYLLKFLSGSREGEPFLNCPFDKRRNGITFSVIAAQMLQRAILGLPDPDAELFALD